VGWAPGSAAVSSMTNDLVTSARRKRCEEESRDYNGGASYQF
jgi:hypothetical protein